MLPSATGRTGRGIKIGKALLSPYAILDATYDTNPGLARYSDSEEDTVFYQGSLVLGLTLPTRLFTLSASGFVSYRDYLDDVTQGENIYGDELAYDGWTYGFSGAEGFSISAGDPDRLQFDFAQSYERVEDYSQQTSADFLRNEYTQDTYLLEDRANRYTRDLLAVSAMLRRNMTDKIDAELGWTYDRTDYRSGLLYDSEEHRAQLGAGYAITDKSSIFLTGALGFQESDALPGGPESRTLRIGWRTHFTVKTAFKASIGVEQYDDQQAHSVSVDRLRTYDPDDPYVEFVTERESERERLSFDLGWIWNPTRKLSLTLSGGNTIEPSPYELGNSREVTVAGLGAGYALTDCLTCSASISYREDAYEYPGGFVVVGESDDPDDPLVQYGARETESIGTRIGLAYAPPEKWYTLFLAASHEETDSNYATDRFGQTRVSVGGMATY